MNRLSRWSQRKLTGKELPSDTDEKPVSAPPETSQTHSQIHSQIQQPAQRQEHADTKDSAFAEEALEPAGREPESTIADGEESDDAHDDAVADSITLPDPDSLPAGSDIRAYLEPGVDKVLRKKALRRLFSAERYNVRDGLDDYDDDFREKLKPLSEHVAGRLRQHLEHYWEKPQEASETESEPPQQDTASLDHEHGPKLHDAQQAASPEAADPDQATHQDQGTDKQPG
ncbi:DUF3306 domain-containing protein [Halomonas binhaiensis]|uniref:DUF3306 domain-containing protein n=1 Tax=Halomonas binhaiensis TaxID=2562282 RepID=A0A856QP82_9GAMM|nr:DUF3306 domain-containing protein [Halomonas binhaiensis]QEM81743.2 DUF3306 domain-containing protein [Halomonas binhaiensis]